MFICLTFSFFDIRFYGRCDIQFLGNIDIVYSFIPKKASYTNNIYIIFLQIRIVVKQK